MNQAQKGFANIILVIIIIVLVGVVSYLTLVRKPSSVTQGPTESDILADLKTNWQSVQVLIPFRPSYDNQEENLKKIWRLPDAVQFIGKSKLLVQFSDDGNVNIVLLKSEGDKKFEFVRLFKYQGQFSLSEWTDLVKQEGDVKSVSTYSRDVVRDGKPMMFEDLTKVKENVFVKYYWQNTSPSTLESQIQLAVNRALVGSAITGYQPIPKGSKLLSTKVAVNNCQEMLDTECLTF